MYTQQPTAPRAAIPGPWCVMRIEPGPGGVPLFLARPGLACTYSNAVCEALKFTTEREAALHCSEIEMAVPCSPSM